MRPFCLLALAAVAAGQELGRAPEVTLNATDLFRTYRLPPLKDRHSDPVQLAVAKLQVGKRAQALRISGDSAIEAWEVAQNLIKSPPTNNTRPPTALEFTGSKASELNVILAKQDTGSVRVTRDSLTVDEPILIGHTLKLDFGSANVRGVKPYPPYLVRIDHAYGATVTGGVISSADSAILVNQSENVTLNAVQVRDINAAGIVVTHSKHVMLNDNRIESCGGAPILLHEGTTSSVVQRNSITGNLGFSNMSAAIVISDRHVDLTQGVDAIFAEDHYWAINQAMSLRMQPPRDNVIAFNQVASNKSSGIYVDGGVLNTVVGNTIERNGKEGICFDNGSTANIATRNVIQQNGSRWGEPDSILASEFIARTGRLSDGTAASKVPGISIDNALYNIIYSNTVAHNFGGGIKLVRTGYYNLIGLNTLVSNNDGASSAFHYFGIEMGSSTLDSPSPELDATPSRGNIIFSNMIRGNHYAGIFFAMDSDQNDAFDNVIMDANPWSLEAVKPMPNSSVNNFTNVPARNIGPGLANTILK